MLFTLKRKGEHHTDIELLRLVIDRKLSRELRIKCTRLALYQIIYLLRKIFTYIIEKRLLTPYFELTPLVIT